MSATVAELVRAGKPGNRSECLMVEEEKRNGGMEETESDEEMWGNVASRLKRTEKMQGTQERTRFPAACLASVPRPGGQTSTCTVAVTAGCSGHLNTAPWDAVNSEDVEAM